MNDAEIKKLFKGKKITLMGLGLLGRGVGDAEFFAEAGADLVVTDLKTADELAPSLARLAPFKNITFRLGGHQKEDFENRDLVIRANNAPLDSPYLIHAREHGVPIEMDSALFVKLAGAFTVGVTGTRGKSTTTHMIHAIAEAAGKQPRLGGNERDMATLQLLKKTKPGDLVILELDSWQLQGFAEDKVSPPVAVWTNFMRDHMNYYRNDMARYFEDKAAIARFQTADDSFITTSEIKERCEARFGKLAARCMLDPTFPSDWQLALPGEHNRANAAFALAAARALGIADDIARAALEKFNGLPGRLEHLATKEVAGKRALAFYNDSNSTTPEATIAALNALVSQSAAAGKNIILIAGGSDKELLFNDLAKKIPQAAKSAILFKGAATEKLKALLPQEYPSRVAASMEEAVIEAVKEAADGDVILLSPGATSFGIFKNEYDRGDQFRAVVAKLK